VVEQAPRLFAQLDDGEAGTFRLVCVSAASGETIWQQSFASWATPHAIVGDLVLGTNRLADGADLLEARSMADGCVVWQLDLGAPALTPHMSGRQRYPIELAFATDDGHRLHGSLSNGCVIAVDIATGHVCWLSGRQAGVPMPMLPHDTRLLGLVNRDVVALDRLTGERVLHVPGVSRRFHHSAPVIAGDCVVFSDAWELVGLTLDAGQEAWRVPIKGGGGTPRADGPDIFVGVDNDILCLRPV
jgi:outer membrane protein assembly factor BamB